MRKAPTLTSTLLNAAGSQLCWWACILGAASGAPWLGPAVVTAFVALHLWRAVPPAARARELRLLASAALLGFASDSALVLGGVLSFPSHAALGWPSTVWMVALWVGLAATLRSSMSWLQGRPLVAVVVGALSGPLAYAAGERLGAASLGPTPTAAMVAIGIVWAIAMPLLAWMARNDVGTRRARLNGAPSQESAL
jgi:hypothetical protein